MFEESMKEILTSILNLMRRNSDSAKLLHSACLEYVPQSILDITTVLSKIQLRLVIIEKVLFQKCFICIEIYFV